MADSQEIKTDMAWGNQGQAGTYKAELELSRTVWNPCWCLTSYRPPALSWGWGWAIREAGPICQAGTCFRHEES